MVLGWSNYHSHSKFCDGRALMEETVLRAILDNIKILGMSSHAPVPFETGWTMKPELLSSYLLEVDRLRDLYVDKIKIYKSLEIDYIPNVVNVASFAHCDLDYSVGSIHFLDSFDNGEEWSFDATVEDFLSGLTSIYNDDIKSCVKRFYELTREMLLLHPPTIIGHFDKIKMHNSTLNLFDQGDDWYVEEIDKTLAVIKQSGVIVEINTKAYDRGFKLFPGVDLFDKLRALEIPVTINSDSHHIDKMILGFDFVAGELLKSGITTTRELIDGKWVDVPLTICGMELPIR